MVKIRCPIMKAPRARMDPKALSANRLARAGDRLGGSSRKVLSRAPWQRVVRGSAYDCSSIAIRN